MRKNIALSLFILVLVVLFSVTCFAQAQEEILFAVSASMTGVSAAVGIQMEQATRLAVKEINDAGGVNGKMLKYIVGDDTSNPNQAVVLAEKLSANKDLLFVLGFDSSTCMATLPVWEKVGIPLITPTSTNPTLSHLGHKNFFRLMPHDELMTSQLAEFTVKELGLKNLALFWENSSYGQGMHEVAIKVIPELGATILADESYVAEVDKDFSSQITKYKGLGVDCVLVLGEYTAGALFIQQARNLGFNAQVVGASGCSHPKLVEIAGKAAEGFFVLSGFDPNDQRPKQAKFIKGFEAIFKIKPGEWGAFTYDIIYVVKKAIEMGGNTRAKLIEVLHSPDFEYEGVTGFTKFDEFGDVSQKSFILLKVVDGKFVTYTPTKI